MADMLIVSAVRESDLMENIKDLTSFIGTARCVLVHPAAYSRDFAIENIETLRYAGEKYSLNGPLPLTDCRWFKRGYVMLKGNPLDYANVFDMLRNAGVKKFSVFNLQDGTLTAWNGLRALRIRSGMFYEALGMILKRRLLNLLFVMVRFIAMLINWVKQLKYLASPKPIAAGCTLCGSDDTCFHYTFNEEYNVFTCNRCGFFYFHPEPDKNKLAEHFRGYGAYKDPEVVKKDYKGDVPYLNFLEKHTDTAKSLKVLELGSGNGALVHKLKRKFSYWDIMGQDIDPVNGAFAEKKSGVKILIGRLPEIQLPPQSFDLILAFHVLEHIPVHELKETIASISRILKKGGRFTGVLPNFNSAAHELLLGKWKNITPADHVSMLSTQSLKFLFDHFGKFQAVEVTAGRAVNLGQLVLNLLGNKDPMLKRTRSWNLKLKQNEKGNMLTFSAIK